MKATLPLAVWLGVLWVGTSSALAAGQTNLLRNPGFEDGATGWELPKTFAVVGDIAHDGSRSLCVANTNPAAYLLARQTVPFQPGMRYRYGAWIKTRGVKGEESGATLCMEWSGAKGWLGGSYADGKKGDQDWFHVEGVTGPVPTNATSVYLELYLRKGMTGTAWFDDVTVAEEFPPALDAVLLKPNYRGRLSAGSGDQQILVRAKVGNMLRGGMKPQDAGLKLSVLSGEREVLAQTLPVALAGNNSLSVEAQTLRPGDYRIRVELVPKNGARLASQEFDLHKLPTNAPQPTVVIDNHNRTVVNGKPFFPLGWYFGPGPTSKNFEQHIDRMADSPFNTIMCYGVNSGSTNDVRRYLDYLASKNVKIVYSIKDVYENTRWYHEPVLGWRGQENIVRNVVSAFRDHPAVLAWYLNDELPLTMRDRLEGRQRLVSELDPNHPTWAVLYQVDDLYSYQNTADVLGTDPYPIPDQPVTMAAEWTQKSRAVSDGHKPLWMVPQAFDWASYRKDHAKGRPPTLDEELVMTYLCLIHGAHGLIYYSYADLIRDERMGFAQRWADMLVVGKEVKELEPALLSTAAPPKVEVLAISTVQWAVRADDAGNIYVLMANPQPGPEAPPVRMGNFSEERSTIVRVKVPPSAKLRLLRHGGLELLPGNDSEKLILVNLPSMSAQTLIITPGR